MKKGNKKDIKATILVMVSGGEVQHIYTDAMTNIVVVDQDTQLAEKRDIKTSQHVRKLLGDAQLSASDFKSVFCGKPILLKVGQDE